MYSLFAEWGESNGWIDGMVIPWKKRKEGKKEGKEEGRMPTCIDNESMPKRQQQQQKRGDDTQDTSTYMTTYEYIALLNFDRVFFSLSVH